jgi:sulfur-carrier protein
MGRWQASGKGSIDSALALLYAMGMEIEIRLFAILRDYLPPGTEGFAFKKTLDKAATVKDIMEELKLPQDEQMIVIVKGNHASDDYVLQDGDVVSIFPPIAGG